MANAYATIASGGWRNRPKAITKVCFSRRASATTSPSRAGTRAFEDGVTAEATEILRKNIQSGTGTKADIGCPAAGKTGTTDDFSDAWFVGYTPRLSTSVWVGHANARVPMPGVAGGTIPATIWHDFMKVAKGKYCGDFPKPKVPFKSAPFFGKYAKTGVRGNRRSYDSQSDEPDAAEQPAAQHLDPRRDDVRPQRLRVRRRSRTRTHRRPRPPPANGNGNGNNGNGNGNGGGAIP